MPDSQSLGLTLDSRIARKTSATMKVASISSRLFSQVRRKSLRYIPIFFDPRPSMRRAISFLSICLLQFVRTADATLRDLRSGRPEPPHGGEHALGREGATRGSRRRRPSWIAMAIAGAAPLTEISDTDFAPKGPTSSATGTNSTRKSSGTSRAEGTL